MLNFLLLLLLLFLLLSASSGSSILTAKLKHEVKCYFRTRQSLSQSIMKIGPESIFPNSQAPAIPGDHTGLFLRIFLLKYYCLFIIKVNNEFHSILKRCAPRKWTMSFKWITVCILTAWSINGQRQLCQYPSWGSKYNWFMLKLLYLNLPLSVHNTWTFLSLQCCCCVVVVFFFCYSIHF